MRQAGGFDFISVEEGNGLAWLKNTQGVRKSLGLALPGALPRLTLYPGPTNTTPAQKGHSLPSCCFQLPSAGSHPKTKPPKKPEGNLESQRLPLGNGE